MKYVRVSVDKPVVGLREVIENGPGDVTRGPGRVFVPGESTVLPASDAKELMKEHGGVVTITELDPDAEDGGERKSAKEAKK